MEQNSTDVIIKTENLINAVQNEPSIWNSELNSSEEEKELAWTRIAGVLQYSKSKLIFIFQRMSCYVSLNTGQVNGSRDACRSRDARTSLRTC